MNARVRAEATVIGLAFNIGLGLWFAVTFKSLEHFGIWSWQGFLLLCVLCHFDGRRTERES